MELEEFRKDFVESIRSDGSYRGLTPEEQFVSSVTDRLVDMGELVDPIISYFGQRTPKGNAIIDGYSIDSADKSITFFQSDFRNTTDKETITKTDLEQKFKQMKAFLDLANSGTLYKYCDESNEYVKVADDIRRRLAIKYVNSNEEDQSIEKIRFIVFTNASLSSLVKNIADDEFEGRKIERSVWTLERFFELAQSGLDREPIEIHMPDFGSQGIPCLKAVMSENIGYDAYLSIIPGRLLSDIYYKYGSRLLEGNVRAFLSNRGKINQGIRNTILKAPTKFFTYNNGIACTASKVNIAHDDSGFVITDITDLQIINGGQTTASLTSAYIKDGSNLENIFVPAKITVIRDSEEYDDMVQKISRYANSQNKVTDADFFSNHPFHIAFEQLSQKILAPAVNGSVVQTAWYYERARGKYNQEMLKMKESERKAFQLKHPKNQIIKKEELGKYYNSINLKPYMVTRGAAKNMADFAKEIDEIWSKKQQSINEVFFKKMICATIIFRQTDKIVAGSSWYETGGFKSQVIPYTISKILYSLPAGYTLDWDKIWRGQSMYPQLTSLVEVVAKETNEFIQDSNGALVSEYAKKQSTWDAYKERKINLPSDFLKTLVNEEEIKSENRLASKDQKQINDINVEAEIYKLGGEYWRKLYQEGKERKLIGPFDEVVLKIACSMDSNNPKFLTPKQVKDLWKLRQKLGDSGVII